eukprot:scaffold192424_cov33-Tisochrysis_lutea.AAC.1
MHQWPIRTEQSRPCKPECLFAAARIRPTSRAKVCQPLRDSDKRGEAKLLELARPVEGKRGGLAVGECHHQHAAVRVAAHQLVAQSEVGRKDVAAGVEHHRPTTGLRRHSLLFANSTPSSTYFGGWGGVCPPWYSVVTAIPCILVFNLACHSTHAPSTHSPAHSLCSGARAELTLE